MKFQTFFPQKSTDILPKWSQHELWVFVFPNTPPHSSAIFFKVALPQSASSVPSRQSLIKLHLSLSKKRVTQSPLLHRKLGGCSPGGKTKKKKNTNYVDVFKPVSQNKEYWSPESFRYICTRACSLTGQENCVEDYQRSSACDWRLWVSDLWQRREL